MSSGFRQISSDLVHRLRQIRSVVRLKPFDTTTPEGLSRERYRRIVLTTITSMVAKGIALLTTLISVPLTVNYLGVERFGLWMTISSLMAFLVFADFGISNGLLNGISEAYGKKDDVLARRYISSSFFMMGGLALVMVAAFYTLFPHVNWGRMFNVTSPEAIREAGPSVTVFVGCFLANFVMATVQRVQLGYQEGFVTNVWQMLGSVLGLAGVLVAIYFQKGLPWLVLAMAGLPALATGINWLEFFFVRRRELLPSWSDFHWQTGRELVAVGFVFMLLNLLAVNWFQSDNLVIAKILGPQEVAGYSIAQKLFSVAMIAQFVTVPLWPAYGEALARSDFSWARRTLNRALVCSVTLTLGISLPLIIFGGRIVAVWTRSTYSPGLLLMLGLTVLNVLIVLAGNLSSLLVHGANLRRQLAFYAVASLGALALKIEWVSTLGVSGVVWGTILAFGVVYTPLALRLAYRTVNPSKHECGNGR